MSKSLTITKNTNTHEYSQEYVEKAYVYTLNFYFTANISNCI